jgi:hypothetical protein
VATAVVVLLGAAAVAVSTLVGVAYASSRASASTLRLTGTVGPGRTISLVNAHGRRVKTLRPGVYRFVVRDRSTRQNFHLIGPGITGFAGTTSIPLRQTVVWKLHLSRGTYTYRSDTNPKALHRNFRVG